MSATKMDDATLIASFRSAIHKADLPAIDKILQTSKLKKGILNSTLITLIKAQNYSLVRHLLTHEQVNRQITDATIKTAFETSDLKFIHLILDRINTRCLHYTDLFDIIASVTSLEGFLGSKRVNKDLRNPFFQQLFVKIYTPLFESVKPTLLLEMIDLIFANNILPPSNRDILVIYRKGYDAILDRILAHPRLDINSLDKYLHQELPKYSPGLILRRAQSIPFDFSRLSSTLLAKYSNISYQTIIDVSKDIGKDIRVNAEKDILLDNSIFTEYYLMNNTELADRLNKHEIPFFPINHFKAALILATIEDPSLKPIAKHHIYSRIVRLL